MTARIFFGHDFFGAGNFGDDLMLAGFLRRRISSDTQTTIVAVTPYDVESQRRRFPEVHWFSDGEGRREEQLRAADVWLGLGSTPFQIESGPWMLDHLDRERELCRRLKKPMLVLGVGCGSPDAVRDPRGRRVIEAAERIWVRDARSAEAIGSVAAPDVVELGADLAHIVLATTAKPQPEPSVLGLLLGLHATGIVDIVAVDESIARRPPWTTRWLVQEARSFPCTERWNFDGLTEWVKGRVRCMPFDYAHDTIQQFVANFGAPETVVSSRYHGALIAAWHGCRLGVIARADKFHGVVADLAVPSSPGIHATDKLEALVRDAVPVDRQRLESLRERAVAMCDAFFAWLRLR
jgi:polysaccharide pyruvyl transferase WcaK-like protein